MEAPSAKAPAADEPHVFSRRVESASVPGRTYLVEVNLHTRRGQCGCPGYMFGGGCRHVDEALEYAAAPPE